MIAVASPYVTVMPVQQERVVSNGIPVSRKTLHLKAEFCMNFCLTTGALVKLVKLCNSSTSSPRFSDAPVYIYIYINAFLSGMAMNAHDTVKRNNAALLITFASCLRFVLRCFCFATCGAPTIDALPYSITSTLGALKVLPQLNGSEGNVLVLVWDPLG